MNDHSDYVRKWAPIVDMHLNIKNKHFRYMCCYYFEFLSSENGIDISEEILNFKTKLSELKSYKKEIKREYINILTGRKEYLLEDGKMFDPESINDPLKVDDLVQIFGLDFITKLDVSMSREFKINQLLK